MVKKKITIDSILKVVDIMHSQLEPGTLEYFKKEAQETYTDRILREHIYNVQSLYDELTDIPESDIDILNDLESIIVLLNKRNAEYLRIIYN